MKTIETKYWAPIVALAAALAACGDKSGTATPPEGAASAASAASAAEPASAPGIEAAPEAASAASAASAVSAAAASAASSVATKPQAAKPAKPAVAAKPAKSGKEPAKEPAVATAAPVVVQPLTEGQLDVVPLVQTGRNNCEDGKAVFVTPIADRPGYFSVTFAKRAFLMTPQETTTGAVRLEDKKAGAVWLQIPTKSMLMDNKAGLRLADECHVP